MYRASHFEHTHFFNTHIELFQGVLNELMIENMLN